MTIEANTTNCWFPYTPNPYPTTPYPYTPVPTQPQYPYIPTQPQYIVPLPVNAPSIEEFEALKKEVARLKELIDNYFKIED